MNLSLFKYVTFIIILFSNFTVYSNSGNFINQCQSHFFNIIDKVTKKPNKPLQVMTANPHQIINLSLEEFIRKIKQATDEIKENPFGAYHFILDQKKKDAEVFQEGIYKQTLIDTFIITLPQRNGHDHLMEFFKLYVNDSSFRERFYKIQVLKSTITRLPLEALNTLLQYLLTKNIPSSWEQYFTLYTQHKSFADLVTRFQDFLCYSSDRCPSDFMID